MFYALVILVGRQYIIITTTVEPGVGEHTVLYTLIIVKSSELLRYCTDENTLGVIVQTLVCVEL